MNFFIFWGFILWLSASALFRLFGQYLLVPGDLMLFSVAIFIAIPLIAATTYPVYLWKNVKSKDRFLAAIYIALPGMLLDVFSIIYFDSVFPNLAKETVGYFGSWLLSAYSLILISGFLFNKTEENG
jgi:ACR3 family arsenite efflux pump ArsB